MTTDSKPKTDENDLPLSEPVARRKLLERIKDARLGPGMGEIYTFGPYADWLRAAADSSGVAGLHLRQAAERLTFALHHDGHRAELKALALFALQLAMKDPEPADKENHS